MEWLVSVAGLQARDRAREVWREAGGDPLRASTALRTPAPQGSGEDLTAEQAAEILLQAELSALATVRHGIADDHLLFTRDGLEAATRPVVADHRAALLRTSGATRVLDLTGGLGLDSAAFLRAGLRVTSVEWDEATATLLAHNCPTATVIHGDATDPDLLAELLRDLGPNDVVFADPARRDPNAARDSRTARARPERDPERWSPPWSFVASIQHPRVAAKVSPSFPAPAPWCAEWVSVDRTVVECAVYSWPVIEPHHRAIVVSSQSLTAVPGSYVTLPESPALGRWLFEIDPAVVRAQATAAALSGSDAGRVGPESTWLTGDTAVNHPAVRSFRVREVLEGNAKQIRRRLAHLGVERASVKCRDVAADPQQIRSSFGLAEGADPVIVATRRAGHPLMVLVDSPQPLT